MSVRRTVWAKTTKTWVSAGRGGQVEEGEGEEKGNGGGVLYKQNETSYVAGRWQSKADVMEERTAAGEAETDRERKKETEEEEASGCWSGLSEMNAEDG